MGYIRSNEDYYVNQGVDPNTARAWDQAEKELGHDGGFCNPRKAKEFDERVDEIRHEEDHP